MPVSNTYGSSPHGDQHTVQAHVQKTNADCRVIFEELRRQILALHPHIEEKAVKLLVRYRASRNFAEVHILTDRLKIHLRPKHYLDPEGVVEHVSNAGFTMDRRVYVSTATDINYVMGLIKQSYNDVPLQ